MSVNVCTREREGRDRRADRRLPVHRRLRQDAVAAGAARHRRAPRRDAAQVPAAGRDSSPRPGCSRSSAAPTPSASASTCRSARCCSPALTKYDGTRHAAAQGPRVPPDRRPGRAGRLRHRRQRRRAGARARDRERAGARQGRRRPEEAAQGACARSRPRASSAGARRPSSGCVAAEPEPLTSQLRGQPRDAAQRDRPAGRRRSRRCAQLLTDNHEDRARAAPAHPPGHRDLPRRCSPAGVVERLDRARRRRAARVRLTVDLQPDFALNQPLSPFALAALELLDPRVADVRARRRVGHRGDARRPAARCCPPSRTRPAARRSPQMKAEGIEYEERMELLEEVT